MTRSRDVRFGRKPVSGPLGKVVDHWAIQVGDTWWEVAGPDDDGHIRARPGIVSLSDGLSVGSDIIAGYIIKHSTGYQAASGAVPVQVVHMTFASWFWWLFVSVVIMFVGWILGQNLMSILYWTLGVSLVWVLGNLAMWKMTQDQYGMAVYTFLLDVMRLIALGTVLYATKTIESEPPFCLSGLPVWAARLGCPSGLPVIAIWVILSSGCILYGIICLKHLYNLWSGKYDGDPRVNSILGTTRKTDQQIEAFNTEFLTVNPQYKGLSVNCQWYARRFIDFLMEEGRRLRPLPPPESPLTNTLLLLFTFVLIMFIVLAHVEESHKQVIDAFDPEIFDQDFIEFSIDE